VRVVTTRTSSHLVEGAVRAAALQILTQDGPEGFTVRAVAQRAGVAPMAIYNHFHGKNGLIDRIFAEGFADLHRAMDIDLDDPVDTLRASGHAYRRFALEHRGHYLVMFLHHFEGFEPSMESAELAARAYGRLVDIISRCVDTGAFEPLDPRRTAQLVWAMVHGYVALEMNHQMFADDAEKTFEQMLDTMMAGLAHSLR
jgi:AcrR family transcriptional regulator